MANRCFLYVVGIFKHKIIKQYCSKHHKKVKINILKSIFQIEYESLFLKIRNLIFILEKAGPNPIK
jgi:hypothetical protein